MPIIALPFAVVVHRCTYWGARHEVLCLARSDLAWLSNWSLFFLQEEILSNSTGLAFLNTELLIKFPSSDENNALGFPKAFWPSDEWEPQTFLSIGLSVLCTYLSLHDHCIGFPGAFWAYSGEVSISCNSPSSRSESAMLFFGIVEMHLRFEVGRLQFFWNPASQPFQYLLIPPLLPTFSWTSDNWYGSTEMLRSLRQSQVLWTHNLWELWCTVLQVFTPRVILDGATCRLRELGDVRDLLSVLVVW